jgi:hypothetical protein
MTVAHFFWVDVTQKTHGALLPHNRCPSRGWCAQRMMNRFASVAKCLPWLRTSLGARSPTVARPPPGCLVTRTDTLLGLLLHTDLDLPLGRAHSGDYELDALFDGMEARLAARGV